LELKKIIAKKYNKFVKFWDLAPHNFRDYICSMAGECLL
jgi:hypothetical protein